MKTAPFHKRVLPISAEAIEKAIELNGVAAKLNLQAFRWGRRAVLERETVEQDRTWIFREAAWRLDVGHAEHGALLGTALEQAVEHDERRDGGFANPHGTDLFGFDQRDLEPFAQQPGKGEGHGAAHQQQWQHDEWCKFVCGACKGS